MVFSDYIPWPSAPSYASCQAHTNEKKTSAAQHRDW